VQDQERGQNLGEPVHAPRGRPQQPGMRALQAGAGRAAELPLEDLAAALVLTEPLGRPALLLAGE
jgi:hypothetical protein